MYILFYTITLKSVKRRKERIQLFYNFLIITFTDTLFFLMWVHIIVGCHLLSTLRTTFSISWKANVLRNLFSQFLFIWECLYLSSVLKEYFAEYDHLDWQFFSLSAFAIYHSTALCSPLVFFYEKTVVLFWGSSFVCDKLFSPCCFQNFLMPMVVCCFICVVILPDYKVHLIKSISPIVCSLWCCSSEAHPSTCAQPPWHMFLSREKRNFSQSLVDCLLHWFPC